MSNITSSQFEQSNKILKKKRLSWYFYDWANSAYSTTVITLFFGPFLTSIAKEAGKNGLINFFGLNIPAGSIFPYSISISVLLQALLLPPIGAYADSIKHKNFLLAFFTLIGSIATILMFFISKDIYLFASLLLIISNISFGAACVIYNSFLVDISENSDREKVSSRGWAFGYVGGGTLLIFNIILFTFSDSIGISKDFAIRLNLALAGIWWALFSIPSFIFLGKKNSNVNSNINDIIGKENRIPFKFSNIHKNLVKTIKDSKQFPIALLFLSAYLLYNDGVQSVISLSSQFGQEELGLKIAYLTIVILVVQFVAAIGSIIFSKFSDKIGEKNSILVAISVWLAVLIYCYAFISGAVDFMIVAIFIALVMGGTQSLSRSLFSKLIPKNKEAEYFSVYEVSEKGTSWLGPLAFGLVYQFTLSYRFAILSLIIFFVFGGIILYFTKVEKGIIAQNEI